MVTVRTKKTKDRFDFQLQELHQKWVDNLLKGKTNRMKQRRLLKIPLTRTSLHFTTSWRICKLIFRLFVKKQ